MAFDDSLVDGIVSHMNEDHADAVALYLQVFAGIVDATDIAMSSIDAKGFDIVYQSESQHCVARVDFEPPLTDAGEVRARLVTMVNLARKQLSD